MRSRSQPTKGNSRSMVSTIRDGPSPSGNNCLGRLGVETGQKREPTPPARTTAHRLDSGCEDFVDSGKQLLRAEGLGQKIRCAEHSRLLPIRFMTFGSEHNHRCAATMRNLAKLCQNVEPAYVGHHDIEQD